MKMIERCDDQCVECSHETFMLVVFKSVLVLLKLFLVFSFWEQVILRSFQVIHYWKKKNEGRQAE